MTAAWSVTSNGSINRFSSWAQRENKRGRERGVTSVTPILGGAGVGRSRGDLALGRTGRAPVAHFRSISDTGGLRRGLAFNGSVFMGCVAAASVLRTEGVRPIHRAEIRANSLFGSHGPCALVRLRPRYAPLSPASTSHAPVWRAHTGEHGPATSARFAGGAA